MNERKKPTPHQQKETSFSQDPIHVARRRAVALLGTGAVAAGLLTGYNTFSDKETPAKPDRHISDQVPLESIQIENGAIIREEPVVEDLSATSSGNKLATIELGDLPEQHTITIDIQDTNSTYVHIRNRASSTPETWIGVPKNTIQDALPGVAEKLNKDSDDTVWINSQKASYSEADTEQ